MTTSLKHIIANPTEYNVILVVLVFFPIKDFTIQRLCLIFCHNTDFSFTYQAHNTVSFDSQGRAWLMFNHEILVMSS